MSWYGDGWVISMASWGSMGIVGRVEVLSQFVGRVDTGGIIREGWRYHGKGLYHGMGKDMQ